MPVNAFFPGHILFKDSKYHFGSLAKAELLDGFWLDGMSLTAIIRSAVRYYPAGSLQSYILFSAGIWG